MSHEKTSNTTLIKKICLDLLNEGKTEVYDNDILLEIIKREKCDLATAEIVFSDMLESGLIACGKKYDIVQFSLLMHCFTDTELNDLLKDLKVPINAGIGDR